MGGNDKEDGNYYNGSGPSIRSWEVNLGFYMKLRRGYIVHLRGS